MQATKSTICFSGRLVKPPATEKAGAWTLLTLPKGASAKLPARGQTMVEGAINSIPFRGALEAGGKGSHELRMSAGMRKAAGTEEGAEVTVEITRAGEEPEVRVPADLVQALADKPRAQAAWADITPMARRDWIFSICTGKLPETRRRRIEKACDMLAKGKRRLCCFPGIKWMMRDNEKSCGQWAALPVTEAPRKPATLRGK